MAKGVYKDWLCEDGLKRISAWARDGLTNAQIAHNMDITEKTLYEWCNKFSEFSNALKRNKEVVDIEVENALFKKALGYNVKVKKTFKVKEIIYSESGKKIKEVEKLEVGEDEVHIPADTTAQIFWLKNRKPESWREKAEVKQNENDVYKKLESIYDKLLSPVENRSFEDMVD